MSLSDLIFWTKADNETGLPNITGDELATLLAEFGVGYTENCRLKRVTDLSTVSGGVTSVPFESAEYDTNNFFDLAEPTRMTFNTAGVYSFGFQSNWNNNNAGGAFRISRITGPGGTLITFNDVRATGTFPLGNLPQNMASMQRFEEGDFITAQVQQNSGVNLSINDQADSSIIFWAARVG